MRALITAVVYFGSFLAIGVIAKVAVVEMMHRRDLDLPKSIDRPGHVAASGGSFCWDPGALRVRIERRHSLSGTAASSSSSQTLAVASEGARQSPRGDSDPPDEIFGPLGKADRLNWLSSKKR